MDPGAAPPRPAGGTVLVGSLWGFGLCIHHPTDCLAPGFPSAPLPPLQVPSLGSLQTNQVSLGVWREGRGGEGRGRSLRVSFGPGFTELPKWPGELGKVFPPAWAGAEPSPPRGVPSLGGSRKGHNPEWTRFSDQ